MDETLIEPDQPSSYAFFRAHARTLIQTVRGQCDRKQLPPIFFDWIQVPFIQGFAKQYRDRFFIGVSNATYYLTSLLFNRMLSFKAVFPMLGNSSLEVDPGLILGWKANAYEMFHKGYVPVNPKCRTRAVYASHLRFLAIEFLMLHELGHIAIGSTEMRNPSDKRSKYAIEFYCDRFAVVTQLSDILQRCADPTKIEPPEFRSFYADRVQAVFDWTFAISTLIRAWGDDSQPGTDLMRGEYPTWRSRQYNITHCFLTILGHVNTSIQGDCEAAMKDAMNAVEGGFTIITCESARTEGLERIMYDDGFDHFKEIAFHWRDHVRDRLQPFAYVTLPPY